MKKEEPIEVWMHKKTGQLWEHFPSLLGYALVCVDMEKEEFTSWGDWQERKIFSFNDETLYNPKNFENLGVL